MPNTRASTRKQASKQVKLGRDRASDNPNNSALSGDVYDDIEVDAGTSITDHLEEAKLGVEKLYARIRSLEGISKRLKSELQRAQRNAPGEPDRSLGEKSSRRQSQIRSLERRIVDLEAARKKDRRIIEKLRDTEVQRDARELMADGGSAPTQQTTDLEENAIKLLRRMCDTIDMNTLAEGEECAICMEEMAVEKCYSLRCRHPVCIECFEKLGDCPNILSNDQTGSIQCPHCREICPREECEIITHTAVEQWDLLLEISQQWAAVDTSEMAVGEDDNDNDSFIDDDVVAASQSPQPQESLEEAVDLDPDIPLTQPDTTSATYGSLPSPKKRERLEQLAAQRSVRQRV